MTAPSWDAIARVAVFGVVLIVLLVLLSAAVIAIQEHVQDRRP